MDLYPCPTEVIATFHSLSVSGTTMGRYSNIVLIMSDCIVIFSKKMACSSSMSVFMASTSNSIMKSTVFHFPCLKVSIFYSASAAFVLLLNIILISLTKLFQSWVSNFSSSSSSFFCVYIPVMSSLQTIDLVFLYFILIFILFLIYFLNFLFLERRVRVSNSHES